MKTRNIKPCIRVRKPKPLRDGYSEDELEVMLVHFNLDLFEELTNEYILRYQKFERDHCYE
jgi:hypothetical protein